MKHKKNTHNVSYILIEKHPKAIEKYGCELQKKKIKKY